MPSTAHDPVIAPHDPDTPPHLGALAPPGLSRRRFLATTGLLAAATTALQSPALFGSMRAYAQSADDVLGPVLADLAGPLLQTLARDTIAGVVAWVVPGDDEHSHHQGVTADLGGLRARGDDFLLDALDQFLPVPATYLQPLARSLLTGVSESPIPAEQLADLLAVPHEITATLDQALLALFDNDQTVPVSAFVALLINQAASLAHPEAAAGPFLSPFANLSFEEKFAAWEFLEVDTAELVATFDGDTPEPLRQSLSGLVRFVAGALVEFAAFGSYSEWGVFDRESERATERPVAWDMASYMPGRDEPADGWDELLGYYGGVRAVEGSWDRGGTDRRPGRG